MRRLLWICCLAFLAACGAVPPTTRAPVEPTRAPVEPTRAAQVAATAAPSPTPRPMPSPTPTPPPRVGVQVGHWRLDELPAELERFAIYTGNYWGGYDEWEVNYEVATRIQAILERAGVTVDLLPAGLPVAYQADAFISIHADGVTGAQAATRRGYKVATPFRASPAARALAAAVADSYAAASGMREDPEGISFNMRGHYIFSPHRFWHSVAPTTPAIMVELGFMTHPADRDLILNQPDMLAAGVAEGVLAYLRERDPADKRAIQPVFYPTLRARGAALTLREQPDPAAAEDITVGPGERMIPLAETGDWYLVHVPFEGSWELGWVRKADTLPTDDPQTPPGPRPEG